MGSGNGNKAKPGVDRTGSTAPAPPRQGPGGAPADPATPGQQHTDPLPPKPSADTEPAPRHAAVAPAEPVGPDDETVPAPVVAPAASEAADAAMPLPRPPAPTLEPEARLGQLLAERYRVERVLGEGAMGVVYLAEHVHMRKPVALKVLRTELSSNTEILARFEREAVAGGSIDDPHVVAANDFGRLDDGAFYLVLEYVEGLTLDRLLEAGALPPARAMRIVRQIVEALVAAHGAGIVHRDLKPENVMLVNRGIETDYVKVLDFGIAKMASADALVGASPLTQVGTVFGTPEYMSPEQATGEPIDGRSDLYTVGIILYELLAGRTPFHDEELTRVLAAHIGAEPPALPDSVPMDIRALVTTQLAKEPEQRTQSAEELLEWCDAILDTLGVAPVPPRPELESISGVVDIHALTPGMSPAGHGAAPPMGHQPRPSAIEQLLSRGQQQASVGGVVVPLWMLAVLGGLLVIIPALTIVVVFAFAGGPAPAPSASGERAGMSPSGVSSETAPPKRQLPPELAGVVADAASGDEAAIKKLEDRPKKLRTSQEWLALGRGKMQLKRKGEALKAYAEALRLEPDLQRDKSLLGDVRRCADHGETAEEAIKVAARHLGSSGADLLYDVWVGTRAKTTTTQLARQLLMEDDDVRGEASESLKIALDLRAAKKCATAHKLLPRATLHGDARSFRLLLKMKQTTGCGAMLREDCYLCLRDDNLLQRALDASRRRPGPSFRY